MTKPHRSPLRKTYPTLEKLIEARIEHKHREYLKTKHKKYRLL